jgi:hypothetical protein
MKWKKELLERAAAFFELGGTDKKDEEAAGEVPGIKKNASKAIIYCKFRK